MIQINAPGADGVASLSSAWALMEAARAGAADATAAARGFLPAAGKLLCTGLHATGFAVGYAVTFPAALVARAVPSDNPIVYGLSDGSRAGIDLARSTVGRSAAPEAPKIAVAAS